jgi:hypothetical protein
MHIGRHLLGMSFSGFDPDVAGVSRGQVPRRRIAEGNRHRRCIVHRQRSSTELARFSARSCFFAPSGMLLSRYDATQRTGAGMRRRRVSWYSGRCCWMTAPTYVENGLLSGISDLSTFVPFLSAFFVAFLSFFSFFFSSFFLPMLFVPCHLRYGRIHQLF